MGTIPTTSHTLPPYPITKPRKSLDYENARVYGVDMNYTLRLTEKESSALRWIADRYTSAEVLWNGMQEDDNIGDDIVYLVPEHVAWRYLDALTEDNGNGDQMVPPCAGGSLAARLYAFWAKIV